MDEIVTVDYLASLLKELQGMGKGDMKIKCNDTFLHTDEIIIRSYPDEMMFRGLILHIDLWQEAEKFRKTVDKAWKKFNESLNRNEDRGMQRY